MNAVSCISVDLINADKPPASLAFLAGCCEKVGLNYHCVSLNSVLVENLSTDQYNQIYSNIKRDALDSGDATLTETLQQVIDTIKNFNSTIAIVSVFSYLQYPLAVKFLTLLKQQLPHITVLAGGPGMYSHDSAVSNGKKLLQAGLVDYYCLGEGDTVLPLWLQGHRNITGINSKKSLYESTVPQIDDLDENYTVPSYKKISSLAYHSLEHKESAVYSISTSRGCVRRCTFCDVAKSWPKFRYRSGKAVAAEILQHHQDVGAVHFHIVDSLINGSLRSFNEFNQEMIRLKQQHQGLQKFSYNGMFIVRDKKSHPEEFFRMMKNAGCESLAIGVETGSDRLRQEMKKNFLNVDLDHHLEMCQKYGIRNNLLMFVAYPTETQDDFDQTLKMLDRYQKYLIDDTIIGINHSGIFSILPDTPVYDHADQMGLEILPKSSMTDWFNTNNPGLTIKQRLLRDIKFRQHAINLRYPIPYADRYLSYLKAIELDFVPVSD